MENDGIEALLLALLSAATLLLGVAILGWMRRALSEEEDERGEARQGPGISWAGITGALLMLVGWVVVPHLSSAPEDLLHPSALFVGALLLIAWALAFGYGLVASARGGRRAPGSIPAPPW